MGLARRGLAGGCFKSEVTLPANSVLGYQCLHGVGLGISSAQPWTRIWSLLYSSKLAVIACEESVAGGITVAVSIWTIVTIN